MLLVLLLAAASLAPVAVALAGRWRASAAGPTAIAAAVACGAIAATAAWRGDGGALELAWIDAWDVRLHVRLDGLARLYVLVSTGIGAVVLLFATRYMPLHLRESGAPSGALTRFFVLMSLFMSAMVGVAVTRELFAFTMWWDLTAVTSYLLIATDGHRREAREAARLALVVTAGAAVLLVAAVVLLQQAAGTTDIEQLRASPPHGTQVEVAVLLLIAAALAKSAQVPLHIWLPRAMVAPTPVSAYLHSAAMVAAGVFLLSLLHPVIASTRVGPPVLVGAGAASILTGSGLALASTTLKKILAYSTVAQYGYVVLMLGLGGAAGASGAAYYVLAHAVAKSGLFMTAGAVTQAAHGETSLDRLGGFRRALPGWAWGSAACAATLAGLPLTIGFFKDELFFAAAAPHGRLAVAGTVATAALTLAYTWRFWSGLFLGRPAAPSGPRLPPVPVLLLGLASVAGGLVNAPLAAMAEAAAAVMREPVEPIPAVLSIHASPSTWMAVAAYAAGGLLILTRAWHAPLWRAAARAGAVAGPTRLWQGAADLVARAGHWLHRHESRDMRGRVATLLVPGALLILGALAAGWSRGLLRAGTLAAGDLPLAVLLLLGAAASVGATRPSSHLVLVLVASTSAYAMAGAYVVLGAPDVALVMVIVQTALGLLMLAMLSIFPRRQLRAGTRLRPGGRHGVAVSVIAGAAALVVSWATLSTSAEPQLARQYLQLAPAAHARDVVTALLADFRGLDTMGEATVLLVALLGLATLLIPTWSGR